jgi:hypothetical protein
MSYLHLSSINMTDTIKGTISLWFRFSKDAVDAAKTHGENSRPPDYGDSALGQEIFKATIPLVTFGRPVKEHVYGVNPTSWSQVVGGTILRAFSFDPIPKPDSPVEPSHIGLVLGEGPDGYDGTVKLKMVFQTATWAQARGLNSHITDVHWDPVTFQQYTVIEDISYFNTGQPAVFVVKPTFSVGQDEWHHLLVSFDLSGGVDVVAVTPSYTGSDPYGDVRAAIRSYCKVWYALDDANKNGKDNIGEDGWVPQDPNGIVSLVAKHAAYSYDPLPPDPFTSGDFDDLAEEYHWAASPMPMNNGLMGLPASAEYVDTVYHCELAEFQFFADIALDTNDIKTRRAFIDKDGKPVSPSKKKSESDPQSGSIELLHKKPEVLLHGSGNWIHGNNTGSTGVDKDGKKLPSGQFNPTAKIVKYLPDPSLQAEKSA